MKIFTAFPRRTAWVTFSVILLFGIVLRIVHLNADIPWEFSWSQGILTDGPWYVDVAHAKIFGSQSVLEGKDFDRPLFTGWAWLVFRVLGTGLWQLNFISVIPGVLTIFFLGLLARQTRGTSGMWITTLLLAMNYFFLLYNRTALIYSTLALFCVFAVWVWQLGFKRSRYFYLAYGLVFVCATLLKFLIIPLLPVLVLCQLLYAAPKRSQWFVLSKKKTRIIFVALCALFLLGVVLFVWKMGIPVRNKILRHTSRFGSASNFVQNLRVVPVHNWIGVYRYMLPECLMAFFYLFLIWFRKTGRTPHERSLDVGMGWLVMLVLGSFFLFHYHPPRFAVFVVPFICYMASATLLELAKPSPSLNNKPAWATVLFVALVSFFLLYHLVANFWGPFLESHFFLTVVLVGFLCVGLGVLVCQCATKEGMIPLRLAAALILGFMILLQGMRTYGFLSLPRYSTQNSIREAAALLPENARVGGPYAHLLGIGSGYQKIWFNLGAERNEPLENLLRKEGISHIALDTKQTLPLMRKNHADLLDRLLLTGRFYARGYEIFLMRIQTEWNPVPMADYEKFVWEVFRGSGEEAERLWNGLPKGLQNHPQTLLHLGESFFRKNRREKSAATFRQAVQGNPYQGFAWFRLAMIARSQDELTLSKEYLQNAVAAAENTPATAKTFIQVWRQAATNP